MKHSAIGTLATFALIACGFAVGARAEVSANLDQAGRFVSLSFAPSADRGVVHWWEPTGSQSVRGVTLNPNGDLRGDGAPAYAYNPINGLPTVVWAARTGGGFDIVASTFDGRRWSDAVRIHPVNSVDDLDPRIAFTPDGMALVVWWQKSASPVVRLSYHPPGHEWLDAGIVSAAGEKARQPAIRQEGSLTIIGYRTPAGVVIVTHTFAAPEFGDGPTPFPMGGDGNPDISDPPPPSGQ